MAGRNMGCAASIVGRSIFIAAACLWTLGSSANADDKSACMHGPAQEKAAVCQRLIAAGGLSDYEHANSYNNLGIGLGAKNQKKEAVEAFGKALQLMPTFGPAIANRAILFREVGNTEFALNEFDRVIAINGRYSFAYFHRGVTHKLRGDLDKAIADFDRDLGLEPDHLPGLMLRADAWMAKGEFDRAVADYDRVLIVKPGLKEAIAARQQALATLAERRGSQVAASKPLSVAPQPKSGVSSVERIFTVPAVDLAMLRAHLVPLLQAMPKVAGVLVAKEDELTIMVKGGEPISMGLSNIRDGLNQEIGGRTKRIEAALKLIGSMLEARDNATPVGKEQFIAALMPVIKNRSYVDALNADMAKRGLNNSKPLLVRPIAGDIVMLVGYDEPNGIRMLPAGEGQAHGVTDEGLYEHAVRNLEKRVPTLKLAQAGPIKIVDFDVSYNASLLVIDGVWSAVAPGAENDIIVALPSRDALVIGSSKDPESVAALRRIAAMPNQAYAITSRLYRRRGKGWVVFE